MALLLKALKQQFSKIAAAGNVREFYYLTPTATVKVWTFWCILTTKTKNILGVLRDFYTHFWWREENLSRVFETWLSDLTWYLWKVLFKEDNLTSAHFSVPCSEVFRRRCSSFCVVACNVALKVNILIACKILEQGQ